MKTKKTDGKPICRRCRLHGDDDHCHYSFSAYEVDCSKVTECRWFDEPGEENAGK